jgi:hypothetical protein
LSIKVMASFFGKLPGFLTFWYQRGGCWFSKARLATFGRKVGSNGNMMPKNVLGGTHSLKEREYKLLTRGMVSSSSVSQLVSILVAMPPEVMIAHVDSRLVGEMRLHPNHLEETKAFL